jgi:glycosyltransferase involved in cell wall biosynthesis
MNILIIQGGSNENLPSGEKTVILNEQKYLSKEHTVNVEYIENKKGIVGKLSGLIWSFDNYNKVIKMIETYKPDITHFHTIVPYLSISVLYAVKKKHIPVIQTLHNGRWLCVEGGYYRDEKYCNDCVGTYGIKGVVRGCSHGKIISFLLFLINFIVRVNGRLFNLVDKFIAVSDFVREQHIQSGFPEDKIIIRNNGFTASSRLDIDDSWLYREGVTYAGRLSVAKGSKVLKYLIKNLDCKINIIGNGPELNSLEQFCVERQFNHVKFFGRLDNSATLDIIRRSVVLVLPSQCGDSYPTVALESLSVGTPVVASNLGGLPEIINSSLGGVLVDYSNDQNFFKSISSLLNNREQAMKFGDNGIKYVKENIGTDKQGEELVKIYNKAINNYRLNK